VSQAFTFTAAANCGGTINATLQLQDAVGILGTVAFPLQVGQTIALVSNYFDSVAAPALPAGWTSSATGAQSPWVTDSSLSDSPPNSAFAPDAAGIGLTWLVSAPITLPPEQTRLAFRNRYDLEPAPDPLTTYDGGVLEIQMGSGGFTDILTAGGSFLSGGYNRTISPSFQNPLAGRQGWGGHSSAFSDTIVSLPAAAAGQTIQLRWGCGTDTDNNSGGGQGWRIDSVTILGAACCSPLYVQSISQSPGAMTFSWNTSPGHTYRVQFKNFLDDTNWTDVVPDITATRATTTVTNTIDGSSQGFYRVFLVQ
jgi:hypothetical protein